MESAIKSPRTTIQQVVDELKRNGGLWDAHLNCFFLPHD